ncbi:hypothetical protein RND61_18915 [Streptomyces sp. TRM76323]|uniref:Integral membrane protein n=1 Tax=Streptomyces tamarix TaxID=3078565 RepID=A0ABU3QMY5_9ACTN|nr:hypothetical protein [Streptomyces tamarix]MDT9684117.1 hypothetical protein [Streptomyces tamarix]
MSLPTLHRPLHRPLVAVSAGMAVMAVVSAFGLVLDDRLLLGAPMWAKPFKFAVSFVAYGLSLAWMLSLLPLRSRAGRRTASWAGTVVAVSFVVEMLLIAGQAVRGRRSHFNYATPFDTAVYLAMGAISVVLWFATLAVAVLLFRARLADRATVWTIRLGTVLALVGAAFGPVMSQPAPGQRRGVSDVVGAHSVGVADGGAGMALTGWSTTGGDLRVPHFVGMHALQLLPLVLLALLVLARRRPRLADPRTRLRLMLVASGAYAAVLALVGWQALRGQPLIHPDTATLAAAAAIAVLTAVGVLAALRGPAAPTAPAPTAVPSRPRPERVP